MKAIVTVGISGSGKSTWAQDLIRSRQEPHGLILGEIWHEINRDDIRFNHFCEGVRDWSKYKWKHEKKVTEIQNRLIARASEYHWNIIISDTNLNKKYRDDLVDNLERLGYEVEILEFDVDFEEAVRRDLLRPNSVGREVIYKQWLKWLEYKGFQKYVPDLTKPECVLVDIDGTVAKMNGRKPYDWDKVSTDIPIEFNLDVVSGLSTLNREVIFLSGRDEVCREGTEDWLNQHYLYDFSQLLMRKNEDTRADWIVKKEMFDEVIKEFNVVGVMDDRYQVISRLWTPLGLPILNVGNLHEMF